MNITHNYCIIIPYVTSSAFTPVFHRSLITMHVDIWLLWLSLALLWISNLGVSQLFSRRRFGTSVRKKEPEVDEEESNKPMLRLGVVLPHNTFWRRRFKSAITFPLLNEVIFSGQYDILTDNYHLIRNSGDMWDKMIIKLFMEAPEDPATIQEYLCKELLDQKVNIYYCNVNVCDIAGKIFIDC